MPDENTIENDQEVTEQPEEKHDGFIALDKHQKDVNVQHKKFRDEERGRVSAEQKLDAAEKKLDELRAAQTDVVIPPVPDQNSETFDADMQLRDDAIGLKADIKAEEKRKTLEQTKNDEARVAKENEALNEKVAAFDSNMVTLGLSPAATKAAADTVIGYGISTMFQDVILEDVDGPLLVTYLSQNPVELEEMNSMSPLQLVNHINGGIRQKASLLKPKTSNAPEPPITLTGGGAPETKETWERGAKYE